MSRIRSVLGVIQRSILSFYYKVATYVRKVCGELRAREVNVAVYVAVDKFHFITETINVTGYVRTDYLRITLYYYIAVNCNVSVGYCRFYSRIVAVPIYDVCAIYNQLFVCVYIVFDTVRGVCMLSKFSMRTSSQKYMLPFTLNCDDLRL